MSGENPNPTPNPTPNPNPAPNPSPNPAPNPAPPAAPPADWTSGFNDDTKGYVQNKGFKDPSAVIDSYRNLEKLLGAPKEKLVRLPDRDDDAPAWGSIYDRLGRPAKPEDYKFDTKDKDFNPFAQKTFHELGLTAKQAEGLVNKLNGYAENSKKAQAEAFAAKIEQDAKSLKTEWGAAYEQNERMAKFAASKLGVAPETIDALEQVMGFSGVMKFMHSLGTRLGEDKFVGGDGGGGGFGGVLSPEAAQNRMQALKADPAFVQKYISGDASAREEMARLHKQAYPDA